MKKIWFYFLALVLTISACSVDDDAPFIQSDPGYSYFPTETGRYIVYEVDSIFHDQPVSNQPGIHDTLHFYLKEVIGSEFFDAEGEQSFEILRYKKANLEDEWLLTDVWFSKRTSRNAERVEENQRFVKLAFPINSFAEWNQNALNDLDVWQSEYDEINNSFAWADTIFELSLLVDVHQFLTEVNDELVYERYVSGIGLVNRYQKLLYTRPSYLNNRIAANIISGSEFEWKMIDYGME